MSDDKRNEGREIIDGIAAGDIVVPMKDGYSSDEFEKLNNENTVSTMLMVSGNGAPRQYLRNNAIVLENDYYLRDRWGYDTFTLEETVELPLPWAPFGKGRRAVEKHDQLEFSAYAESKYMLTGDKRAADAIHMICHRNEYDSAQQLLKSLKYEGGIHREDALSLYLGVEDTPYTRAVSKLAFDAATMRIMHPGCKYDYVVALIGRQGIGKSEFTKRMALRLPWHIDKIKEFDKKAGLELLRAKTVYEIAELSDIKGARLESLKQWITSQIDTYRAPYDIRTKDHPRRFIVIATTNEAAFLDDPTGSRRWLPVWCGVDEPKLDLFDNEECEHWFAQAYAEAMVEYNENGGQLSLVLPKTIEASAEEARSRASIDDPDEGRIQAYMLDNPNAKICTGMILQNVYYDQNIPACDTPTANRVASILNSLDWLTKSENKERLGMYGSVRWWMYEV